MSGEREREDLGGGRKKKKRRWIYVVHVRSLMETCPLKGDQGKIARPY